MASVAAVSHSARRRAGVRHGSTSLDARACVPSEAGMSHESHSPFGRMLSRLMRFSFAFVLGAVLEVVLGPRPRSTRSW